jgi:hypothetical protein
MSESCVILYLFLQIKRIGPKLHFRTGKSILDGVLTMPSKSKNLKKPSERRAKEKKTKGLMSRRSQGWGLCAIRIGLFLPPEGL